MTASPTALHSAIYRGRIQHRRHFPHAHQFHYPLFMLWLDLDELDRVFAGRWLWSVGRRNIAEFRRSDYLGDPGIHLRDSVRACVEKALGWRPQGPIRLLTHLRYFGFCFNPVSFYYCYDDADERVEVIVAEITNTPWKERHQYVLETAAGEAIDKGWRWNFHKDFHVSPFLPMTRDYRWRFSDPGENLFVHMDSLHGDSRDFDASLTLRREALNARNLARCLLRFPLMTVQVVAAIHWQALRLWLKRNPVYDHPRKHPQSSP